MEKCENCDAYAAINPKAGQCRARPPVAQFYGMEQIKVLNRTQMRPICGTNYPEVSKDSWCREYSPVPVVKVFDPSKLAASGDAQPVEQVMNGSQEG